MNVCMFTSSMKNDLLCLVDRFSMKNEHSSLEILLLFWKRTQLSTLIVTIKIHHSINIFNDTLTDNKKFINHGSQRKK